MSIASPLRLALVGAAHPHVDYALDEALRRDDVTIVAVCDHDPARRAAVAARAGAPAFETLDALLAAHRIDAAAVTTEPGLRAAIVARLLEAGVFVIVDKPMATSFDGLAAIEAARAGRPLLTLLLEKRRYPVTRALKELVDRGALGRIVTITTSGPHKLRPAARPDWYFDPDLYGGILNDLVVHEVDLALWLTGETARRICGWTSSAHPEGRPGFSLAGRALLETASGMQVAIDVDWLQPEASPRHGDYAMRVTGTLGRADVDFARNVLSVEAHDRAAFQPPLPDAESPARYAFDHLAKGAPLAITAQESVRATRLSLLAQQSAREGGVWMSA
ncbi:MAG: Gfo/Idh/MocA family oxidoreductase [Methylobacteriaceae bacterium]|nr:Gfo/Idh/MocA family oxidoreductase [Methylobacteriaceae bacterium]